PSYLIERTDNGGSTYATEKTATAGEFFVVPNQVGRQYRAVMVAPDTTRTVGAWLPPVSAAGPQIAVASVDGRTLAVQTPAGTGTLRARPYGGGTAITAAVSGTTTNITLTGNGCWQIDYAPDGVTYGALAYRWCFTLGAISRFGRNVGSVGLVPYLRDGIVVGTPISGRQATMDQPTPAYQMLASSFQHPVTGVSTPVNFHINGAMKNFVVPLDYSDQGYAAFDNRMFSGNTSTGVPFGPGIKYVKLDDKAVNYADINYRKTFEINNLYRRWPDMLSLDDGIANAASGPDGRYVGTSQAHRKGLLDQVGGFVFSASQPVTTPGSKQFPQQVFRHSTWTPGHINVPYIDDLCDTLFGYRFSSTGMSGYVDPEIGLARLERLNLALAMYRGGNHDIDSHERLTTYLNAFPLESGNYYQNTLVDDMVMLSTLDVLTEVQTARLVYALAAWGSQIDIPGKQSQNGAGISQHHEMLIMFSRIARGLGEQGLRDLAADQPGNHLTSFIEFKTADLPMLQPHSNPLWPGFARHRTISYVATASGIVTVRMPLITGESQRQYYQGLTFVSEATG
ncbi:hypothetical protein, partial [Neotabrizicola sp. sgz301269]|uniref:hypothetical protein n=1 Tax=Neotabrizicola sp. sgz301269 TaxID=3276282 RepID=UPI00376FA43A